MHPLLINTSALGGAANSCLRLHSGLQKIGVNSRLLLRQRGVASLPVATTLHDEPVHKLPTPPPLSLKAWLREKRTGVYSQRQADYLAYADKQRAQAAFIASRPKGLEFFSYPYANVDITQAPAYAEADIINLHWVANFLDYPSFFQKNTKPLVWTLHDMNPFSGGQHYTETTLGIRADGKPSPFSPSEAFHAEEKNLWNEKHKLFKEAPPFHVVTPSQWLTDAAEKSTIWHKKTTFSTIPYGLDTEVFTFRPQEAARAVLGLPQDKKILLFVAASISNQRKGFAYLQRALHTLKQQNNDIVLCAIGEVPQKIDMPEIVELGFLQDELLLSTAYAAADVFVIPSLMDNLPNTVLEALCSGTPVVGFPIGGIPDMVEYGKNGYLCPEVSVGALSHTLQMFFKVPPQATGQEISSAAHGKYALEKQAKAYTQLYEEVLANQS